MMTDRETAAHGARLLDAEIEQLSRPRMGVPFVLGAIALLAGVVLGAPFLAYVAAGAGVYLLAYAAMNGGRRRALTELRTRRSMLQAQAR